MPNGCASRVAIARNEHGVTQTQILWTFLFGSVGLAFFMYGKKQQRVVPLVCGIALMVYPYFVPNTIWLISVGIALCVVPYFYRP